MKTRLAAWGDAAQVYRDRRVLSMLFLGFSSGLPFGVLAEPFAALLIEAGISKTSIGLFALVSLPYSLKFLWAPAMDRLPLPLLGKLLGRRRGWALLTQICLLGAICAIGFTRPDQDIWWTAFFAVLVAFASASQDIAIDAYRVEILKKHTLAAGAATAVFGWRAGQLGGAAAGLVLADFLPWSLVFTILGVMVGIGIIAVLLNPEPPVAVTAESKVLERKAESFFERSGHLPRRLAIVLAWFYGAAVLPFIEFSGRRGWVAVLLFIMLYKFGDAVLAIMKMPFFLELGFTKTKIAEIVKVFGAGALIAGAFLGGLLLARLGILKGLMVCGVLMAASNLIFVVQAWMGANPWMLIVSITVENTTTGMGTIAFVAYLSSLCNVAYTATQYALLTSLMAFSRTVLSSGAGWLADQVDWPTFFIATAIAALPGLLLLLWMIRRYPPEEASARTSPLSRSGS